MTDLLDHLESAPGHSRDAALTRAREAGLYGWADLGPGRCHYQLTGPKEGPVVVLVHGFSVPSYIFDPTVEALGAVGRRVLRFDLYGRGFSARPRLDYGPDLFNRQLTDLLNFLDITGPVDLVGLSMGGAVSAYFAVRHPDLVRRIVFLDPVGFSPLLNWKDRLLLLPGIGETYWRRQGEQALKEGLLTDLTRPGDFPAYFQNFEAQLAFRGLKRALLSSQRQGMLNPKPDLYQKLAPRSASIMLLWGREDRVIPAADAARAQRLMPNLTVHLIDRAGHIPHYERPLTVNPILLDFLG